MPEKLLHEWNPALGPDCKGLLPDYYYCLLPNGFVPMPLTVTTAPAPTQTGIASNCKAWYRRNQSETCSDIVRSFGTFSEEDFKAWNPAVGQKCAGLTVRFLFHEIGNCSAPTNLRIVSNRMVIGTVSPCLVLLPHALHPSQLFQQAFRASQMLSRTAPNGGMYPSQ